MNTASRLLQQIGQRAVERAQWAVLGLFLAFVPAALSAWLVGLPGLLVGLLFLGGLTLRVMLALQRVLLTAVLETASVYTLVGRVVEFQVVPEWHIVGAE